MPGFKDVVDAIDVLAKVAIAVATVFIYGAAQRQAENSQKLAQAAEAQATAKKTSQETQLVIVNKLLDMFAEIRKNCLSDDQTYMVHFLVNVNNKYNDVPFDDAMIGSILSAQSSCTSADAKQVQATGLGAGSIPALSPTNIRQVNESLQSAAPVQAITQQAEQPDGYVAVGSPAKGYQNFFKLDPTGSAEISPHSLLQARWPVYLRSNTNNTDSGQNAIRGIIGENQCVRVLQPYPDVRGQTWAAVKLADCGAR